MWKQKSSKMRSGIPVLQWAREEHVLGLVQWCAGELGAQIIHRWPGFFSTPPSSHPSFQGFAPVSACLFIQCLQPVETNPRVFHPQRHPWIILRAHMDPLPHAMALGITAPKQRLFSLAQWKPAISAPFIILAFKALHLFPHACSPNVCNLWKLIQRSLNPWHGVGSQIIHRRSGGQRPMDELGCRHCEEACAEDDSLEGCWIVLKGWDETVLALVQRCAVPWHRVVGP